jgi:hypothetical protein
MHIVNIDEAIQERAVLRVGGVDHILNDPTMKDWLSIQQLDLVDEFTLRPYETTLFLAHIACPSLLKEDAEDISPLMRCTNDEFALVQKTLTRVITQGCGSLGKSSKSFHEIIRKLRPAERMETLKRK